MTAIEDIWGPYYAAKAQAVVDGTWSSEDTWQGFKDGMVEMSPYNEKLLSSDLIAEAKAIEEGIEMALFTLLRDLFTIKLES